MSISYLSILSDSYWWVSILLINQVFLSLGICETSSICIILIFPCDILNEIKNLELRGVMEQKLELFST